MKNASESGLELTEQGIEQFSETAGLPFRRSGAGPLVSPTTPGAPSAAPAAGANVQSQAMNGAQVSSLVEVIQSVVARSLPSAAAIEVLKNAFPAIPETSLQRMLESAMSAPPAPAPQIPRAGLAALNADPLFWAQVQALAARHDLPALPPGMALPTDAQLDAIARAGAPGLAAAFTGIYAPVRQLILNSRSPEALQASLAAWYPDHSPARAAELTELALTAYLANGAATARHP